MNVDETKIAISKDVPLPSKRQNRSALRKVLESLEVGDSFFYPDTSESFRGHCYTHAAFAGIKVTTRRSNENDADGVRVWRIK